MPDKIYAMKQRSFIRYSIAILLLLCTAGACRLYAQQDSSYVLLQELLKRNEEQRLRDSFRIAFLMLEVEKVKHPRSGDHKELLDRLQAIRTEDSLKLVQEQHEVDRLRKIAKGHPVRLFNDTLLEIYAPLGSFTAELRAKDAHEKILALFQNNTYHPDSFSIQPFTDYFNIMYGQTTILTVSSYDALWMNQTKQQLARTYLENIKFSIDRNRVEHSWEKVALRWTQVLIIVVVAALLLRLLSRGGLKLIRMLGRHKPGVIRDVRIRNYELFSAAFLLKVLIRVLYILRIIFMGVIVYFAVSFILNVFPQTQPYTRKLWDWVLDPVKDVGLSIVHYIPNLFKIAAIIIFFRYIIYAFRYFSLEVEKGDLKLRHFHPEWARTTYQIIRIVLIAFCIVFVFPYLPGSDTIAFKGISVFAGVLISFGSSTAISNTIAGFVITYMRPFKVGDWIKVGNDTGRVKEKTVLVTRIETINNEEITIPNSSILSKHTINYSSTGSEGGLVITATVTMAYAVEWRKVHEVLREAACRTEYTNKEKEPYVFQNTLDSYYVTYQINVYTQEPDKMYFIHTALLQHIQDGFKAAGIDLHLPAQITIKE